jgi:ankyrin repeat protein
VLIVDGVTRNRDIEESLRLLVLKLLRDRNFLSTLFQALHYRPEFKEELSKAYFDSIPTDPEALQIAAYWNLPSTAETLLQGGADPSPPDSRESTPLYWACPDRNFAAAEVLLENGADVNRLDSEG